MKTMKFLLLSFFCCCSLVLYSQNVSPEINAGFKSGNVALITKYFAESLDVKILSASKNNVSKSNASNDLAAFFRRNAPKDYVVLHTGERNNSSYCIGKLTTSNGEYRVTLFFRKVDSKLLIDQLKIENN